jgi:hypothetical protein
MVSGRQKLNPPLDRKKLGEGELGAPWVPRLESKVRLAKHVSVSGG